MPRAHDLSTNERDFVVEALKEGLRLDARPFDEYRKISLDFGQEYGSVDLRLGDTRVVTKISASVTTPLPDRSFEGLFTISTELSPMVSPEFEVGRPTITETLMSRLLEKTIRRTSALDTESLCLIAGQKCFHVRADVHVVAHDGNLLDAACISVVSALLHFRRPDVTIEGESVTVWGPREREPLKLSILHTPYCVSFSYYSSAPGESRKLVIIDATATEEKVRQGEVVISVNKFGEVCQIAKYGSGTVEAPLLLSWTRMAVDKAKQIDAFVQERLKEDESSRNVGDLIAELSAANDR